MNGRKRLVMIGFLVSLALMLSLTPTAGAQVVRSPANGAQSAAVTPPPLSVWDGDIDYAYQVLPGLADPPPGSAAAEMGLTLPGVNPPGLVSSGENGGPPQINPICPVDTIFFGTKGGWEDITGNWFAGLAYMYTNGIADSLASIAAPGNYRDFSYEVRMLRLGGTSANRLIVRGTPLPLDPLNYWDSEYSFQYTRRGYISILKIIGGVHYTILDWKISDAVNQGDDWNTLRVEAEGTSLSYYINGTKVWSGTDTSLSAGRLGVGMARLTDPNDELRVYSARVCVPAILTYLPVVTQP